MDWPGVILIQQPVQHLYKNQHDLMIDRSAMAIVVQSSDPACHSRPVSFMLPMADVSRA